MSVTTAGSIWRCITRHLRSCDLVRLHCTGNRSLRAILEKQGGVDTIVHHVQVPEEAKTGHPFLMSKARLWPRYLLVRFRNSLRSFHISGVPDHAFIESDPPINLVDFQILPSTLTSLIIQFHVRMNDEIVSVLPSDLQRLTLMRDYSMPLRSLPSLPRSLTRFESMSHWYFQNESFIFLPSNLTHLELPQSVEITSAAWQCLAEMPTLRHLNLAKMTEVWGPDLALLPRFLLSLNLASAVHLDSTHLVALPATLISLELTSLRHINDDGLKWLPRGLTSLNLECATGFSASGVNQLPPRLTRLNLGITNQLENIGISSLPKTITHLTMERASTVGPLKKRINLPNLTYLSCPTLDQFDDSTIAFLPQTLTVLNLIQSSSLTEQGLKLLPPHLNFLSLCASTNLGFNSWKSLSTNIQRRLPMPLPFELLRGAATDIMETELREAFSRFNRPYELHADVESASRQHKEQKGQDLTQAPKYLLLPGPSPPRIRFEQWIQETMTRETLLVLPQGMEYLDLMLAMNLKAPYFKNLPRGLRELYLPMGVPVYSSEFSNLPSYLETLFIGDQKYTRLSMGPPSLESILASRPSQYASVLLARSFICTVSSMHFSQLPRSLKHLVIQTWSVCADSDISHLPPQLISLVISPEKQLTDSMAKLLPRTLVYLDLSANSNFTDVMIPDLPRTLTHLNLAKSIHLTDACIPHLPRGLRTFIAIKSRHFSNDAFRHLPRSVTHLQWDFSSHFTDDGAYLLPSTLTHLSLRRAIQLTDKSISQLPRSIITLKLTYNQLLTANCVPHLPPNLERFEARFTAPYDYLNPDYAHVPRKFNPTFYLK